MKGLSLLLVGVLACSLAMGGEAYPPYPKVSNTMIPGVGNVVLLAIWQPDTPRPLKRLKVIKRMLNKQGATLKPEVISKTLMALQCAKQQNVRHSHILTIIDYSLPSNKKRLWVFDLHQPKLLFHTYVSHGIKSGVAASTYFSNTVNSKATSIGIYNAEKVYRGRHGLSLKLHGLDKGFNSNAYNRFIVMHGSWYVDEKFIKKYGRAGRSWGCPTLPPQLTKPIINTIKGKSFLVAYYPGDRWLLKSIFLNCKKAAKHAGMPALWKDEPDKEGRGRILFRDKNNNNKREENEPIIVVTADNYQRLFNKNPPLKRMLRRQINQVEYIALNNSEIKRMDAGKKKTLESVYFVIPVVKKKRGYWATEMKIVGEGKVKEITITKTSGKSPSIESCVVNFEGKSPVKLKSTGRFIRWLGL